MRSERVVTNLRCSQNCAYCTSRSQTDDLGFIAPQAVRERIDGAVRRGARELVLTGGEPTLRRDLAELVAHARGTDVERVTLETNARQVTLAQAEALARAGLDAARVNLAGWGQELDRVTRDPGGFEATLAGMDALLAAGVALTVQAAVTRSTAPLLPALPERLAARFLERVTTLTLTVPVTSPDPRELLPLAAAAETIAFVEARARTVGVSVKLAPDSGPPPCVFEAPARVAHLYTLTPGAPRRPEHSPVAACGECAVADRCPGFPDSALARFGVPDVAPISGDRMRRRLSLIGTVKEQIAREFVTPNRYLDAEHGDVDEDIIRVNFHCNQSCRFCFVSTHLPAPGDAAVREAIADAARRNRKVTLSGGEPTLNARLPEYVRLAKSLSRLPVLVQTNAVRLDDPNLVAELVAAGLDEAFVSLHGATADCSDTVTGAPGTFARSLDGLDRLAEAQLRLTINFVLCETNQHELVPWVRLLASRWPRAFANVSFVAPSTDVVPRDRELIPRYGDVLPHLAEAVRVAAELGVDIGGFESMCGIPLCLVPAGLDRYFDLSEVPPGFDRGEFVKPDACSRCELGSRCYGLRRGYAELHGTGELTPVVRKALPA